MGSLILCPCRATSSGRGSWTKREHRERPLTSHHWKGNGGLHATTIMLCRRQTRVMEQVLAGPPVPRSSLYRPAAAEVRVGGLRHPRTRVGRVEWNCSEASGGNPRPRLSMHGHWRLGGVPWAWVRYVTSVPGFRIYTTATAIHHMTCLSSLFFG